MTSRPFLTLLFAEGFALLGTRLSMIAVPWLVLTELGDPLLAGIVAFAEMAPYVLAKAAGGPLIDRLGARRVSIVTDAFSVAALAALPLLFAAGLLVPATLVPLMAVIGLLRGPADAAKYAMIPAVAETSGLPMTRVTGLLSSVERLAGLLGAGLAAGLVAVVGPANALLVNAGLVGLAALTVLFGLRGVAPPEAEGEGEPYLTRLAAGWRYLRQDGTLLAITLMVAATNLLDQGMGALLLPVWAEQTGSVAHLGAVQMALGAGAVTGSLVASAWAEKLPRLPTYAIAYIIVGLPRYALFVLPLPFWALLAGVAFGGFMAGFLNPIIGALIFERVPKALTGRVTSLFTAIAWAGMPFGGLIAGALVEGWSLTIAFIALGSAYFVATMAPLLVPSFRQMDRVEPVRAPEAA
ncbi:MFS transporter [Pseudoroseicyclus tamaricis]|uniref:MFS transporter n=1 Tax=Pseudoroseicyclus tamaricis TaxID=2705421 RepID=A0A6B2JWS3_9RHOB|nr:MFS transporter [Pseudoroseicyclus tamaricis]NDV00674.1 MFS transporter [Pseudoroseicyclus tamaricis]